MTIGWKLDPHEREELLKRFPPTWPDVVADHVTFKTAGSAEPPQLPDTRGEIVGQIDDGDGLQALIVGIDGEVDRPDGSTYHITWSLFRDRGRQAAESNDVIKRLGWRAIDRPVPIKLMAAMF